MKKVGNYRLEKEIGRGAFGTVYSATHVTTKAVVAVKAIPLSGLNGRLLKQLERELSVMKTVKSPYVVQLLEVFKTTSCVYIVMEYCTGGDLETYTKAHHHVEEPIAKRWLANLLDGFTALQHYSILHRDLKLANILLSTADDQTAVAKIADFGFARFASETSLVETMLGTPLFMAPEILDRVPYTYKVDIWSLGVIAYEIMVGAPAFVVYTMEELAAAQRRPLQFPANCQLSEDAKGLILYMMQYNAADRPDFAVVRRHQFFQEKVEVKAPAEGNLAAEGKPAPEERQEEAAEPGNKEQEKAAEPGDKEQEKVEIKENPVEPSVLEPPQIPPPPEVQEPPKPDLIDQYEVIEDRVDEESKIMDRYSVVEDSQFIAGNKEVEGAVKLEVKEVEEAKNPIEGVDTEAQKADETQGEKVEQWEEPAQVANREEIVRTELLRLDFKCTQELQSVSALAELYIAARQYLISFAIYLTVSRELSRAFAHFASLCQTQGIVRESNVEAARVYEKLQETHFMVNEKLEALQVQLTAEDLTKSVMRFEDEGLRVEGRLLVEEAKHLHSALASHSAEQQPTVLRQALSILSIAASDPTCEVTANALMTEYSTALMKLLGAPQT